MMAAAVRSGHLSACSAFAYACAMPSSEQTIYLHGPSWLAGWLSNHAGAYPHSEERMQLAIELSAMNVAEGTGGPFGAVVVDMQSGRLISAGVNRVIACSASMAHAEMMAITAAQQKLGCFDLAASDTPDCALFTSCEPCAMCFGALPWSGVRHLICAARDGDARAIGFDEGPKMATWRSQLEKRGITIQTDLCRADAVDVLQDYAKTQGVIYNGRHAA